MFYRVQQTDATREPFNMLSLKVKTCSLPIGAGKQKHKITQIKITTTINRAQQNFYIEYTIYKQSTRPHRSYESTLLLVPRSNLDWLWTEITVTWLRVLEKCLSVNVHRYVSFLVRNAGGQSKTNAKTSYVYELRRRSRRLKTTVSFKRM